MKYSLRLCIWQMLLHIIFIGTIETIICAGVLYSWDEAFGVELEVDEVQQSFLVLHILKMLAAHPLFRQGSLTETHSPAAAYPHWEKG